jgi:hypothetical protein
MPDRCSRTTKFQIADRSERIRCSKRPHARGLHVGLSPEGSKDARILFFADGRLATATEIHLELDPLAMEPVAQTSPDPAPPLQASPLRPVSRTEQARASGYSGDTCHKCGSLKVIRTGTCGTCQDCGESTSCG